MTKKRALITGCTGQDGQFLTALLHAKGYEIHGLIRRNPNRPKMMLPGSAEIPVYFHEGDVTDLSSCAAAVRESKPDEVYHLAAQSHVGRSFSEPHHTTAVTGLGTLNMLEAVKISWPVARFYFASTSELFGGVSGAPCNEQTPFAPRSPYAVAKLYAHHMATLYRAAYGMHVSCGILFNHESEIRPRDFVTRKITMGIRDVLSGEAKALKLGNMSAKRDWGFAGDYVDAMWRMLQQESPGDYVIGTGETHSIAEFLAACLDVLGAEPDEVPVSVDPAMLRPAEVNVLIADATKAREVLGWRPAVDFRGLVGRMMANDCGAFIDRRRREAIGH